MAGAVVGGWASDGMRINGKSRFDLQVVALTFAAPLLVMLGWTRDLSTAIGLMAGLGFFKGIYEGTLAVSLYDYVAPRHRSSAAAVVLLLANLLAASSAVLLGYLSDFTDLGNSFSALASLYVVAAWILWTARRLQPMDDITSN